MKPTLGLLLVLVSTWAPEQASSAERSAATPCLGSTNTLCLDHDRFRVTARFRSGTAPEKPATGQVLPVAAQERAALALFFGDPGSLDVRLVLRDRCASGGSLDLVAAATTFAAFRIQVDDLAHGVTRTLERSSGAARGTLEAVAAFACTGERSEPSEPSE